MTPLIKAHQKLFKRYNQLAQDNKDKLPSNHSYKIHMMGIHAISHPEIPLDKMARWLGFVQGILFANGIIDINEERDVSRPLFHAAYKEMNLSIPKSIDLEKDLLDSWE